MVSHFTIGSVVWILEFSEVGCKDFGKFFGEQEEEKEQDTWFYPF